jgi:hypothetical protein
VSLTWVSAHYQYNQQLWDNEDLLSLQCTSGGMARGFCYQYNTAAVYNKGNLLSAKYNKCVDQGGFVISREYISCVGQGGFGISTM